MSFWDFFGKKDEENAAADSSAGFVPAAPASDTDTSPEGGTGTEAPITDSGASAGGDGGGASGDGGGV